MNTNSRADYCETLLAQAFRDTPTFLDYVPSYKGVLKRKEKRKEGEPNIGKKKAPTVVEGAKKKTKQPRVRLPTFRKSAAHWFEPLRLDDVEEPILLGLNVPLQSIDPTTEEMSRRNVPRSDIPTKTTNLARTRGPSNSQREERQKTTNEPTSPSSSQPVHPEELRVPTPNVIIPEPHIETYKPPVEAIIHREFSPSYTSPYGRVVLLNDFVKAEPSIAITLLRGLALPRDMDQVPTDLFPRLGEMCSHLVQVYLLT